MSQPPQPALVHFPIAFSSLAVVADFADTWLGEALGLGPILFAVGCMMVLAAMLAGLPAGAVGGWFGGHLEHGHGVGGERT